MDSFNLAIAAQTAQKGKPKAHFQMPRRKTLEEALEEAERPLTLQQRKYRDKYGMRYAVNGSGVGCVLK